MNKIIWCLLGPFLAYGVQAQELNGFDLSNTSIPVDQILSGGPPRDGIPSIDHPEFKGVDRYREFSNQSEVLGVFYNNVAKAYPINIMDWHEIVNDDFNGKPVVVTYCPLCGSGIAFGALVNGEPSEFGVSGLLYNSDVLLYDRKTNSLWSQILARAVSGPMKDSELEIVSTHRMSLGTWKELHPKSLILTTNTGYKRNYSQGPYSSYDQENRTYFPLSHEDDTFHKKEWVYGMELNGEYKAYPVKILKKNKSGMVKDSLGGKSLTVTWDRNGENFRAFTNNGEEIISLKMFWFAWVAFHPETLVFRE